MTDGAAARPAAVWTIAEILKWAADDFRARGIDAPRLDAEVLLAHALGASRVQLVVDGARPLVPDELARFRDLVKRRRTREPVAYLRGEREFYGRRYRVDKRVLVPRPETEILVETALARTAWASMSLRALDLCTGSGCVAITMARERPTACVLGTDLSADALDVARDNAQRLGATNAGFARGDLFEALQAFPRRPRRFDVITANPPYIPTGEIAGLMLDVRVHEPRLALDGGADGLRLVERIVEQAPSYLAEGGVLALEIGAGEADAVAALLEARGFEGVGRARDYARIERVVHGIWRPRA